MGVNGSLPTPHSSKTPPQSLWRLYWVQLESRKTFVGGGSAFRVQFRGSKSRACSESISELVCSSVVVRHFQTSKINPLEVPIKFHLGWLSARGPTRGESARLECILESFQCPLLLQVHYGCPLGVKKRSNPLVEAGVTPVS